MVTDKYTSDTIFHLENRVAPLRLLPTAGARELTGKIDHYLTTWARGSFFAEDTFIVETDCPRFASGDGKGIIRDSIRGDDLYLVVDVGNYNCSYKMFGLNTAMSPDDHFQDLKRLIQATSGKARRISVIMPILYGGRQHFRGQARESLDCAVALQELQQMGVQNIITFDAHDPHVQNAIPLVGFDNVMPYYQVMKALFRAFPDIEEKSDKFMVVSPDEGAINRNMYYASILGVDLGMFYKRRDYSRIVDGRNPIVAHEYLGNSVEGRDVLIADDLIASGDSILDIAYELKKRKAKRIFAYATYALFTHGLETMDKAYEDGIVDSVFGTNLTYRSPELLSREWFHEVDVSKYIAYFIAALNHDMSVSMIIEPHDKIEQLLENRRHMKK